ncbi:GNAT family N-acetyltransferase [Actinomycetospora soli]|uniref:GNAT family N-acetyltransferase n=1 Tax=Actinomycetospora soli TaxID=2893887 RepID=UPI001E576A31|nr:GNAT family N-acetyltransferase [Actinomycetospora soli]MCD2187225.1 GNAT family N-acetyltransferase [Actinomycetospora soli]
MDIALLTMTPDEFEHFRERQEREYVESLRRSRSAEAAERKARDDLARLLPDGADTPGHRLLTAWTRERTVGQVWLGPSEDADDMLWLYEIRIDEDLRGQGYGRAVMAAVERVAHGDGAQRLGLNVFGGNRAAIALYTSAGYEVTAQQMAKQLTGE